MVLEPNLWRLYCIYLCKVYLLYDSNFVNNLQLQCSVLHLNIKSEVPGLNKNK